MGLKNILWIIPNYIENINLHSPNRIFTQENKELGTYLIKNGNINQGQFYIHNLVYDQGKLIPNFTYEMKYVDDNINIPECY